ncbi:MAG: inner-rane translocator, partial [Frankiales bacterium]|nr:inner-rane translocator [Frankiales bacterium]
MTGRFSAEQLRRLAGYLFLGLVLAVITGPDGSGERPLAGVRGSLEHPRVLGFLAFGAALYVLGLVWPRLHSAQLSRARTRSAAALTTRPGRAGTIVAMLAVAVFVPLALSPAAQGALFLDVGIFALLALGLNVVVGYAGLLDLGYIAFYAIGAYTTAYFTSTIVNGHRVHPLPVHSPFLLNPFFVFPIALVVASIAGIILGGPTLRLRGDYLAIVTLGFGEIV